VFPATALGGSSGSYGAPDGWYPWAVSVTQQQTQGTVVDGRNPDTVDAALAAHPSLDPAIVKYLERYGYTRNQIDAMATTPATTAAHPSLDPAIVKYLERYGYTRSQILAMARPLSAQSTQQAPVDGRSPDTIDFAAQAHSPVVTIVHNPSFHWGDFGVGGGSALALLLLLGLSLRFFSNRQNRGGQRPVTTS
jgi:hypothetical protein